jgi:hypothetical protein
MGSGGPLMAEAEAKVQFAFDFDFEFDFGERRMFDTEIAG